MAKKRISMRKIKEVLRLKFEVGLSYEAIGKSCNLGHTIVGEYLLRAKDAGLEWPVSNNIDDNLLEQLLYPPAHGPDVNRAIPD